MRILFISDNFPPEVNAPANRTFEHCREWVRAGHEVTVITGAPNFPEGKLFPGYKNRIFQKEVLHGIHVHRVWTYISANKGFLKRTLDYLSFCLSASLAALFVKSDIIIATSPQFFSACAGYLAALIKGRPWIMEVRDLWPESIRAVGAMKNQKLFKLLEKLELFLYSKADAIVVVTDSFRSRLVGRGVPDNKIFVIKNGVDLSVFGKREKDQQLIAQLGVTGKKIIIYAGTLGMAHAIDFIIHAAKKMEQIKDLHFIIIGSGAEAENLRVLYNQLCPSNLTLLEAVTHHQIPAYLSIADYALVNLKKSDTFSTVLPSKIFECAAMQLPIILGVSGEARDLVLGYKAGIAFSPEDFESFRIAVSTIISDSEMHSKLSEGAARLASDYNRTRLAKEMLEVVEKVYQSKI